MKLLTWTQVIGLGISVVVAVVLFARVQDELLSIVIGLLLAVLTQLVEVQIKVHELDDHLAQIGSLGKNLPPNRQIGTLLKEIVDAYRVVFAKRSDMPKVFKKEAAERLKIFHEFARNIHVNRTMIASDEEPYHFSSEALRQAQAIVRAVDTGDLEHWATREGRAYSQLNISTQERGVRIVRVVVQAEEKLYQAPCLSALEAQVEAGVELYLADPKRLDPRLDQDYLIVDEAAVAHSQLAKDGQAFQRRISGLEADIQEKAHSFESLVAKAVLIDRELLRSWKSNAWLGAAAKKGPGSPQ